jgi:glc operon protein GlcG
MKQTTMALALVASLAPAAVGAQTARPMLDYATAAKMRDSCLAWSGERKLQMAIAIYDDGGKLLAFAHMDGARTGSNQLAQDKGLSAARFRIGTATLAKRLTGYVPGIIIAGGGVPFSTPDGVPLGGIGASGGTADEDIACGRAAIEAAGLKPEAGA